MTRGGWILIWTCYFAGMVALGFAIRKIFEKIAIVATIAL